MRKGPGAVARRVEAAAVEGILDAADSVAVVGRPEGLPRGLHGAAEDAVAHEALGEERREDGGQEALERLEDGRVGGGHAGGPPAGRRLGLVDAHPAVEVEDVGGADDGEEDGDDGEGRGKQEAQVARADMFIAVVPARGLVNLRGIQLDGANGHRYSHCNRSESQYELYKACKKETCRFILQGAAYHGIQK